MGRCFDKYIFVAPGSDYGRAMWSDLENDKSCIFLEYPIIDCGKVLKILHHIHFSFGINKRIALPGQTVWKRYYSLSQIDFNRDLKFCIILPDVSACRIDIGYLEELSRKSNVELVLVNVNIVEKKTPLINARLHCFSKVFSFDKQDCADYGYIFHPTIYSKPVINYSHTIVSDAFFVGSYTKDRYRKLVELHNIIVHAHGQTDFHIIGVPKAEKRIDGIFYNKPIDYKEVISRVERTNCIVEIMNPGQSGLTLRAMEAVCCNKKLLTDNETAKDLKYFSKGFIAYDNPITEVDIDFIMRREDVDYNYDNDFSPLKLIEHIEKVNSEVEK